jgi:hypothetical protein
MHDRLGGDHEAERALGADDDRLDLLGPGGREPSRSARPERPARIHRRSGSHSGPAGPEAVVAAFGSISPMGIAIALDVVEQKSSFDAV